MNTFNNITGLAVLATLSLAVPQLQAADGYIRLSSFPSLTTTSSTTYIGTTIDGTTAYNAIGGTTTKEFTKSTGLGGTVSTAQITSSAAIDSATGGTGSLSGILRSSSATAMQIPDTTFDSVFRVNKTTGAISTYVDKATLQGTAAAFNVFGSTILSTGEAVIYDNTSASPRYRGTLNGAAYDVATLADIRTAAGGSYTYGGLTAGPNDNLILPDSNSTAASRRILQYNPLTGTATTLLTASDITAITGGATAAFLPTALYYSAGDGLVYFYDNTSKNILSFNPSAATPASTLQNVLTSAQLTAGPEGANAVTYFTTYNSQIAWVNVSLGGQGLYAVPEPASLGLLSIGAALLVRRRRA